MSFPKIIKLVPIITRLLFLATTVKPSYFDQHVLGHVLNVELMITTTLLLKILDKLGIGEPVIKILRSCFASLAGMFREILFMHHYSCFSTSSFVTVVSQKHSRQTRETYLTTILM